VTTLSIHIANQLGV